MKLRSNYTTAAVFRTNQSAPTKKAPKLVAPDNQPTKEQVLAAYCAAADAGNDDLAAMWMEVYTENFDTI